MSASTTPGLLIERASSQPNGVAVRQFRLGIWQESTWSQVCAEAAEVGAGLVALGVKPGDTVALVADNSAEWVAVEIGAQGIGAVVLALAPDLAPSTVEALVASAGAIAYIAGDEEQFDKLGSGTTMRFRVVIETRGMRHLDRTDRPDVDETLTLTQLKARGGGSNDWKTGATAIAPSADAVMLAHTEIASQRTVHLERFTHEQLVLQAESVRSTLAVTAKEIVLVQRPLADANEHTLGIVGSLVVGYTVHHGETGLETQAMRQVQPTVLHATASWVEGCAADAERQRGRRDRDKEAALSKGLVPREPQTAPRVGSHARPTTIAGIATAALILLWFFATTSANDVMRLVVAGLIAGGVGLALVFSGKSAAGPVRRHYGLSRCRAVLVDGLEPNARSFLGGLDVPVIPIEPARGTPVASVQSEVLV